MKQIIFLKCMKSFQTIGTIKMDALILEYGIMVAGILFTLASIVISETGKIFIANILFLCGDIVYLIYAIVLDNIFGMVSLVIALIFAIRTLYKMYIGLYFKNLKKIHKFRNYNRVKVRDDKS